MNNRFAMQTNADDRKTIGGARENRVDRNARVGRTDGRRIGVSVGGATIMRRRVRDRREESKKKKEK